MELTIRTNHHRRQFVYRCDVPEAVLATEFDYQDPEETTDGFFCYRGFWYHLDQFMYCEPGEALATLGWHGFAGDSAFSGVAIRVLDDGETYQIARCYC
jgi:hypothetical protein